MVGQSSVSVDVSKALSRHSPNRLVEAPHESAEPEIEGANHV